MGYFITQVGLSAASFGVAADDVMLVGESLNNAFNYRCAPPAVIVAAQGPQLQAICQADACPLSVNDTCSAYGTSMEPMVANATLSMGEGTNSTSPNSSSSASGTERDSMSSPTADSPAASKSAGSAASVVGGSLKVLAAAAFAFAL